MLRARFAKGRAPLISPCCRAEVASARRMVGVSGGEVGLEGKGATRLRVDLECFLDFCSVGFVLAIVGLWGPQNVGGVVVLLFVVDVLRDAAEFKLF